MNKIKFILYLFFIFSFEATTHAQNNNEPWVTKIEAPQYFAVDVENMETSVAWYKMALGLKELEGSASEAPDGRWQIVNLYNDQLFVELIRDNRAQKVERAKGFAKVGFQVESTNEIANRIFQLTGERFRVVTWEKFNMSILQLHDPDGNTIQLTSKTEP